MVCNAGLLLLRHSLVTSLQLLTSQIVNVNLKHSVLQSEF